MYKKAARFASRHPVAAKRAIGIPITDELVRQRRNAAPDNPIVPVTGTCVYCGSNSTKTAKALKDKIRELNGKLRLARSRSLIEKATWYDPVHKRLATQTPTSKMEAP
jgi:hypothetical protein